MCSSRVLVVEDDAASRRLMTIALGGWVAEVHAPESLAETWRLLRVERFAAVLMDIHVFGVDSRVLLAEIRKIPATHRVSFIAVTGRTCPEDKADILAAGFDGYIAKPFSLAELRETTIRMARREHVPTIERGSVSHEHAPPGGRVIFSRS